ncbi:hypothetical protein J4Q44_G00088010 [Coregonus suidteri]|uniref:Gypsy retrotransposon integrase-like protein 1 n=1 Tax=Coregonus suidteri TaxID=861788 RepID=A0AAN8LZK8_9TELE
MPSASTGGQVGHAVNYVTSCWAHHESTAPMVPVKVDGHDTEALFDSGSMVTLVTTSLLNQETEWGREMSISCLHGDKKRYPAVWTNIVTPQGSCQMMVGAVPELPVPILVGRDCPLFTALWWHELKKNTSRPKKRAGTTPRQCGQAPPVNQPDSTGPESESEGEGEPEPEPPGEPLEEEPSIPLLDFEGPVETPVGGQLRGQFGTAQWEDPNLKAAAAQVIAVDGQLLPGVSDWRYPHFQIKNNLLYQVSCQQGELREVLLPPRRYVGTVLQLAHTHLLGVHLGMEKTRERIAARFHWTGMRRAVEVEAMLRMGFVEESHSAWCSPIVLVPKPDGQG